MEYTIYADDEVFTGYDTEQEALEAVERLKAKGFTDIQIELNKEQDHDTE